MGKIQPCRSEIVKLRLHCRDLLLNLQIQSSVVRFLLVTHTHTHTHTHLIKRVQETQEIRQLARSRVDARDEPLQVGNTSEQAAECLCHGEEVREIRGVFFLGGKKGTNS